MSRVVEQSLWWGPVGTWHCVVLGVLFCESVGIQVMQVMQDLVGQLGLLALVPGSISILTGVGLVPFVDICSARW